MTAKFRIKGMNKPFLTAFAANLKALREKAGLSLRKVSALASKRGSEVSPAAWCQWESAARSPHIERLPYIAEALGVHVSELIPWSKNGEQTASEPEVAVPAKPKRRAGRVSPRKRRAGVSKS